MGRARASMQRLADHAGPIAVVGLFLLMAVVVFQQFRISALQQAQAENSRNGRAILKQVAAQGKTIQDQTDPNSKVSKDRAAALNGILDQLFKAFITGQNDQVRRVGEMLERCTSLPCSPAVVGRILAEPVPMVTFTTNVVPMAATTPRSPTSPVVSVPRAVATPSPGLPSAPAAPPSATALCPAIQVAPLNVLRVCIPP